MRKFISNVKYDFRSSVRQTPSIPSRTEPDQAVSLHEMLYRFTHGSSVSVHSYEPLYDDPSDTDFDVVDPSRDFFQNAVEFAALEERIQEELESVRKRKSEAAKLEVEQLQKELEALRKLNASMADTPPDDLSSSNP